MEVKRNYTEKNYNSTTQYMEKLVKFRTCLHLCTISWLLRSWFLKTQNSGL